MKTKNSIQEEALEAILPHSRCTAVAGTGVGKTLLGLKHMSVKYYETIRYLVVAPKLAVFDEWKAQAKEHDLEGLLPHIKFTTYLSLTKMDLDYDVVYVDECHNLLDSHRDWLEDYSGEILGLTGTPPTREYSEKGKIINQFCPVVYEYLVDDAVEDGIINDYEIIVHAIRLSSEKNMQKKTKAGKTWLSSEKADYDYWTKQIEETTSPKALQLLRIMRMKALMTYKSKERLAQNILNQQIEKTILFCNTIEQADRLISDSYTSKNKNAKENLLRFKNGEILKLSCVQQLSEGINIPNLKVGIIMHAYGNEKKLSQRFGRLCRLLPHESATLNLLCYIDTIDEHWCKQSLEGLNSDKIRWIFY
jgi:superfamily II DNA or RNA helicase